MAIIVIRLIKITIVLVAVVSINEINVMTVKFLITLNIMLLILAGVITHHYT